jgi:hypothetical protein
MTKILLWLVGTACFWGILMPNAAAQPTDSLLNLPPLHSPRTAIVRSALLPGLGQVYNQKYWKLPIIYAALGAAGYMVYTNNIPFKDAKDKLFLRNTLAQNPTNTYNNTQATALLYTSTSVAALRTQREAARKNRDTFILVALAVYGLQLVDASVDAHLFDFNINDDISLNLQPQPIYTPQTTAVSLLTVRWQW